MRQPETFFIYYFRQDNGEGEYVIISGDDLDQEALEEYLNHGYHFEEKIKATTHTGGIYKLPFDTELKKH